MTLDELVESRYDELNENDLYIWQYIFHHKTECQKMSIQQLAHACNVSHTSIIRFTKKIEMCIRDSSYSSRKSNGERL